MRRLNAAALLGSVMIVTVGCGGGGEVEVEGVEAPPLAEPIQIRALLDNRGESPLVSTLRGPGQVGYLQPRSRREGNEMVTTFRIQNISDGALAGFKVDEFWYDDAGDTVTGGAFRMRRPFLSDEIIEVTLRIPRNSRMARSNYEFSHQNGVVEANLFDEMDEAPPEAEAEADAAADAPAR
jgi:hypothetical protein